MNLSFRGPLSSLISLLLSAAAAAAGLSLVACNGAVGSGNAPRNIVISAPSSTTELPTLHMYQCLTSGLRALLYFTDGSVGDFTNRVKWSSSNTGAVQVSNGDIPIPGNLGIYTNGTLIPAGNGSAVVTAEYFGIVSQVAIGVGAPQSINVKALQNGVYTPLNLFNPNHTSTSTGITLAAGTTVQLAVTALLDGVETDVTRFAVLGFQNPNPGAATMSATGLVTAGNTGSNQTAPLVPLATFPPCNVTNITDPNNIVPLTVSRVQSVAMQPEFPQTDPSNNALLPLIVGNTEKFTVMATMANGDTQDVSAQSTLTSSSPTVTFTGGANGAKDLLTAVGPQSAFTLLQARFTGGGVLLQAPSINFSTTARPLITITSCWSDPFTYAYTTIQACPASQPSATVQAGSLTPVQFHMIGYYGTTTDASGNEIPITQEITRQTAWSVLSLSVASMTAGGINAGEVVGLAQGSTQVEGIVTSSTVKVPQLYSPLVINPIQ